MTDQLRNEIESFDYATAIHSVDVAIALEEKFEANVKTEETDNSLKIEMRRFNNSVGDSHHFARLAMMMAEEKGIELSYEEALKQ